jgi:alanine racemase
MSSAPEIRPTWVDIDTAAYTRNIDAIRRSLPSSCGLIAVLKADGYGHGAVQLARKCTADRVAMIATSLLEEALELRQSGIALPLLVLGPLSETQIATAVENDVVVGIVGPEELERAARVAKDRDVVVHLKLDSGMGRMGVVENELDRVAEIVRSAPRLRIDALYSHFANAGDATDPHTEQQIAAFDAMVRSLAHRGVSAPKKHLANSAATVRGVAIADFVRVGLALLGAEPLDNVGKGVSPSRLEPVMRWRTEIARLKTLPPNSGIGYGVSFRTTRESRIATLPVGYADGYSRLLSNNGEVLVRGKRAPVVGRVSMDLVTIDVTDLPDVRFGDEVVLLGAQGSDAITAEELAQRTGTISYEVFCRVSKRVPRFYR